MKPAIAILFLLLVLPAASVIAATINVPADQPTIQAGIDSASNGDVVLVAAGVYTGDGNRDIVFEGKHVTLRSADGPTSTIIDCEGAVNDWHKGFILDQGEGPFTVIDGFTIRNGYARAVGGAIYSLNAGPTIDNCIFDSNRSAWAGGALGIDQGSANIRNCLFVNNEAANVGGAGFFLGSLPIFNNCTFFQNGADTGATFYSDFADPVIYNCLITHSQGGASVVQTGSIQGHGIDFECTNIWGNPGGDWPQVYPTQLGVNGNISENPLYCAGVPTVFPDDLYLSSQSPCAPDNHECGEIVGAYGVACTQTGVDENGLGGLPGDYRLAQNYPNPFNPATQIRFDLPRGSQVRLRVFNILGQEVAELVNEYRSSGPHVELWDGSEAPSGIYLYRLDAGEYTATRKMLLLK